LVETVVITSFHFYLHVRDKIHWLRAGERITFKLYLIVYKAINGLAIS